MHTFQQPNQNQFQKKGGGKTWWTHFVRVLSVHQIDSSSVHQIGSSNVHQIDSIKCSPDWPRTTWENWRQHGLRGISLQSRLASGLRKTFDWWKLIWKDIPVLPPKTKSNIKTWPSVEKKHFLMAKVPNFWGTWSTIFGTHQIASYSNYYLKFLFRYRNI